MSNALIITSVASMVDQFLLPSMYLLQEMGYKVFVACNFEKGSTCSNERVTELKKTLEAHGIEYYQVDFERNATQIIKNRIAYKQLLSILSGNKFDLIHCHSPVGGMLGRLAARKARKTGTQVIYTAHGFHFYKGAPLKNWLMYYPVEKFCSRFTDKLITINKEDFELTKSKFKSGKIYYVPGVGINVSKFADAQVDKNEKRKEIGVPADAIILTSVGELSKRKNHIVILRALAQINNDNLHYVIVGKGTLLEELQAFANDNGLSNQVHFLGYRKDISEIYKASDVCCLPSVHEGLPVALMEAMASGLPCVASRIRGNTDLLDEKTGFLVDTYDVDGYANAILQLLNDEEMRISMGQENKKRAYQYSLDTIIEDMRGIYEQ